MKKLFILTIMTVALLTGCGKEEANVETSVETMAYEETEDVCLYKYSEEYVENMKNDWVNTIEETWEKEGIPNEECKDEIIKLVNSIEYNPEFEYGYDLENLQIDYVNILVDYNVLPYECYGHTIDELEAM